MVKRSYLNPIILLGCVVVDQATKSWGATLPTVHYNEGFIMGLYSSLPPAIRIVALGSLAGFILLFYAFSLYVISRRARWMKYGLSFLMGGVFGNVVDKIMLGKTVDFIPSPVFGTTFNLADVFQWIGAGIVVWFLFARDELLWHPESLRQNYLVKPREQLKMALQFTFIAFVTSILLGIFSFTFFNVLFGHFIEQSPNLRLTFFVTYGCLAALFCALVFLMGIIISHRTAGPLYAFEMYVEDLLAEKDRKLTLRDGDNYRHFEQVADKLRERFRS